MCIRDRYFRLNALNITLPPLKERPEDIKLLSVHFLNNMGIALQGEQQNLFEELLQSCLLYTSGMPGARVGMVGVNDPNTIL